MTVVPFPQPAQPPGRTYKLTKLSTVRPRPITWLLPGRVPYGGLTVLAGRPGQGKSQLSLAIAANVTLTGTDVLVIGAEDGLEDAVRPRLVAAGADLDKVSSFDPQTHGGNEDLTILPHDVPLLERAVKETGAGLVIVDPFAAHLAPELNSNNDHSLRQATAPLARMARSTGVAVIIVAHLKKGREGSPMDWVGGSIGLTGAARSVLLLGQFKDDDVWQKDAFRYLCHVKANGAPIARTLQCKVEAIDVEDGGMTIPTSRIVPDVERHDIWAYDLE
jgi:hypothetical protein